MVWGSLIAAGASLAGGLLGRKSDKEAAGLAEQNMAMQREFAQQGIRWRVEDAKAAGIHPLYALGAQTTSYSPIGINFSNSLGEGISNAGQHIGRAIDATRTPRERVDAYSQQVQAMNLDRMSLENEALRMQVEGAALELGRARNPPIPSMMVDSIIQGQGNAVPGASDDAMLRGGSIGPGAAMVRDVPLERVPGRSDAPGSEPGAVTDQGYSRTPTGWAPVPSQDVKQRIEDNLLLELQWAWRNQAGPMLSGKHFQPPFAAPEGHEWIFHPTLFEYQLRKKRRKLNPHDYFKAN